MSDREIIELRPEPSDEGEIRYARPEPPRRPGALAALASRALGLAIGVALFLALLFFFFYVVLPVAVVLFLIFALRRLFRG